MTAIISDCGEYRWVLSRRVPRSRLLHKRKSGAVLWVMLNPSTADASLDDPTIRRCMAFTASWGYEHMVVVNLYAYRATEPTELWNIPDPVGKENDYWVWSQAVAANLVVCAWGAHAKAEREAEVLNLLRNDNPSLYCLGTNKDGSPKHPLYLAANTPLQRWM